MGTHRAVVIFETKIDLSSFGEGNFYRRTFHGPFEKRKALEAFDEADVPCQRDENVEKFDENVFQFKSLHEKLLN